MAEKTRCGYVDFQFSACFFSYLQALSISSWAQSCADNTKLGIALEFSDCKESKNVLNQNEVQNHAKIQFANDFFSLTCAKNHAMKSFWS